MFETARKSLTSTVPMNVPTTIEIQASRNGPSIQKNPLNDPLLQAYLNNLAVIKSSSGFRGWRKSFLQRFETFLEPEGVKQAIVAYKALKKSITRTMSLILQLKDLYSRDLKTKKSLQKRNSITGDEDRKDVDQHWLSVRSRRCLSELTTEITSCIGYLDALIPTTMAEEQKQGFTKFQMGAVLIRDQFSQYNRLLLCVDSLARFEELLKDAADKQTLKTMEMFRFKFQIFCDIMADLGLFIAMQKCLELDGETADETEEDDSEDTTLCSESLYDEQEIVPPEVVEWLENVSQKSIDKKETEEPEEKSYHCCFCRMAIMGNFDPSIFCRASKEERMAANPPSL